MNRFLFCICCGLFLVISCKKEQQKNFYNVEAQSDRFIFSSINPDTVVLDFALVRSAIPDTLPSGALLNGFYLDTGTLPVTLIPQIPVTIEKNRFVFKNLDTLRNEQELHSLSYNIREPVPGSIKDTVKNFIKYF